MKSLLFPVLASLLIFRLGELKVDRDRADRLALRPLARTFGRRAPDMTVEGEPVPDRLGRWRLADPRIEGESFAGEVVVGADVLGNAPELGRRVAVTGPFRPILAARNPGRVSDGLDLFRPPRLGGSGRRFRAKLLPEPASLLSRVPLAFARWRQRAFAPTPGLLALEDIVWTGDDRRLSAPLRAFYREGGLFHLVALSGARVAVLASLLSVATFALGLPRHVRPFLPTVACSILFLTSGGASPVRRILPMALAFLVLRSRRWDAPRLQSIASAVAIAIVIDPSLLSRPGFLLSAFGTALLLHVVSLRPARSYLIVVGVMPLLMVPLTAFFFAKVGWLAPVHCFLLTWLWDFFLVPLGFLLPILVGWLPLGVVEKTWCVAADLQLWLASHVGTSYQSVIRPTLAELFLFFLAIAFWRKPKRSS